MGPLDCLFEKRAEWMAEWLYLAKDLPDEDD